MAAEKEMEDEWMKNFFNSIKNSQALNNVYRRGTLIVKKLILCHHHSTISLHPKRTSFKYCFEIK
jgi:hypothetical protein